MRASTSPVLPGPTTQGLKYDDYRLAQDVNDNNRGTAAVSFGEAVRYSTTGRISTVSLDGARPSSAPLSAMPAGTTIPSAEAAGSSYPNYNLPSGAMLSGSNQLPYLPSADSSTYNHMPASSSNQHYVPSRGSEIRTSLGEANVYGENYPPQTQLLGDAVTSVASNGLRPSQPPGITFAKQTQEAHGMDVTFGANGTGNEQLFLGNQGESLPNGGTPFPTFGDTGEMPNQASPLLPPSRYPFNSFAAGSLLQPTPRTFDSSKEYATYMANLIEVKEGVSRTTIKLPRSKFTGEADFKDGFHRSTMFAPCEANMTLGSAGILPAEEGVEKSWLNSYVYQESSPKSHFSAQFSSTQNENEETPTYIDPDRARQRAQFLEKRLHDSRQEVARKSAEENETYSVEPFLMDSYTGDQMVSIRGQLFPKRFAKDLQLNRSDWDEMIESLWEGGSIDNLRTPWPFDPADRDKRVDMRSYNWFDRNNPFIKDDDDYEFIETASNFVDPVENAKWRLRGGDNVWDQVLDVFDSVFYVE